NVRGAIDWNIVDAIQSSQPKVGAPRKPGEEFARRDFAATHDRGELQEALRKWQAMRWKPLTSFDAARLAEVLADTGSEEALQYIRMIETIQPVEADLILARLRFRQKRNEEA